MNRTLRIHMNNYKPLFAPPYIIKIKWENVCKFNLNPGTSFINIKFWHKQVFVQINKYLYLSTLVDFNLNGWPFPRKKFCFLLMARYISTRCCHKEIAKDVIVLRHPKISYELFSVFGFIHFVSPIKNELSNNLFWQN